MANLKEGADNMLRIFLKKQKKQHYSTPEGLKFSFTFDGAFYLQIPDREFPETEFFIATGNVESLAEFTKSHGYVLEVSDSGKPVITDLEVM